MSVDVGKRAFCQELGFVTLHRRALSWTGEVQVYLCNEVCLQGFEVSIGREVVWAEVCLRVEESFRGKSSFLFAVLAFCDTGSLRFGRGTWCSPVMCRVDGR